MEKIFWRYDAKPVTLQEHTRVRLLHTLTHGLVKTMGRYFLYKWRRRQMKQTEYLFARSPKYQKLFQKVKRKKAKIDQLIITQL